MEMVTRLLLIVLVLLDVVLGKFKKIVILICVQIAPQRSVQIKDDFAAEIIVIILERGIARHP